MAHSTFQQSISNITSARDQLLHQAKVTGLRKRHSLFTRPDSRDGSSGEGRTPPSMSARSVSAPQQVPQAVKSPGQVERRSTEPESKRHSLFGRRKSRKSGVRVASLEGSLDEYDEDQLTSLDVLHPREHFESDDEYYRYLKKQTISPPFNFQHNVHTRRKHIPGLDTVDEKELEREFWAASAYQTPRRQLNGIEAEDLDKKLGSLGVSRGAQSSTPTSAAPSSPSFFEYFSEPETRSTYSRRTTWDGKRSVDSERISDAGGQIRNLPKRQSSLGSQRPSKPRRESFSSFTSQDSTPYLPIASQFLGQALDFPSISSALEVVPEATEQGHSKPNDLEYRSTQPLPALPSHLKSRGSKATLKSTVQDYLASSGHPNGATSAPHSQRSSHILRLAPAATISSPDLRRPKMVSGSSWEDDVDFCYEQEAESTCDFDWEAVEAEQRSSLESESSNGKSKLLPIMRSPSTSLPSTLINFDSLASVKRIPNVVHPAMRQARHDSRLYIPADGNYTSLMNNSPSQPINSPPNAKSALSPGSVDLPPLQAIGADSASDLESLRSTRRSHRESSSYSSRESIFRDSATSRDTRHCSLASMDSVPELYHSFRSSTSANTAHPAPQRSFTTAGCERTTYDRQSSNTTGELTRKPSTLADAAISHAGRASVRTRPPTPSRFSKLLTPQHAQGETVPKEDDEDTNWI